MKNKRNTEAVEVAPTTLMAGRVVEFKPAAKRPLAEVEAAIRQRVTQEEALRLARQAGEAKLAAAKASGDAAGFGEVKTLSRTKQPAINPRPRWPVLKADVSKLPAYVGVEVPGQGYGVYRIGKVTAGPAGRGAPQAGSRADRACGRPAETVQLTSRPEAQGQGQDERAAGRRAPSPNKPGEVMKKPGRASGPGFFICIGWVANGGRPVPTMPASTRRAIAVQFPCRAAKSSGDVHSTPRTCACGYCTKFRSIERR
jgi:hypothetical protein